MNLPASNDLIPSGRNSANSSTLVITTTSAGGANRLADRDTATQADANPLKKPGAWPDVPVPAASPGVPIYVRLPCTIGFGNVPADALQGQLTAVPDGPASSKLTIVPPLGARSAVDVLTDNALADEIASLPAARNDFNADVPAAAAETPGERIARVNARLAGNGTLLEPYAVSDGPLFVLAPITLAFPGVPADAAQFQVAGRSAQAVTVAAPPPTVAATAGGHRDVDSAAPRSVFFHMWETADRHVPFPVLYHWLAWPAGGQPAAKLHELSRIDFVYRITNEFSAHLTGEKGAFSPPILRREPQGFRLLPMQSRQGLLTPEQAELAIEKHLEQRTPGGEPTLEAYRALPWASLVLEHPFAPGQMEPVYRFRKAGDRHEFTVGARSGQVR